jgi:hypothetical protein
MPFSKTRSTSRKSTSISLVTLTYGGTVPADLDREQSVEQQDCVKEADTSSAFLRRGIASNPFLQH